MEIKDINEGGFCQAIEFVLLTSWRFMMCGKFCEKWVLIIDLANLSAFSFDMSLIKKMINQTKGNYPGLLHKLYLCNLSMSISLGLRAVKAMVP